ncbi:MAG: ABC transporter ATP-binding protein [Nakamurella sp.]
MIEANGLTKVYGRTVAVDNLSFAIRPGMVTGFLGPNGSGKSTTMRMILGLDRPQRGQATIGGRRYGDLKNPLRTVGSLLDANWVHPNRTARAHLRWMATANGIPRSRVEEVLGIVGLSSVADKAAGKFSLGMKQRLGIASALLGDPEVLLFDEPVNGLDPEGIHWIRTFMKDLATQGRTVFVSSHLLSEMALTADHLIVIGRGRLIADASTKEFVSQSTESSVLVRSPQLDRLPELLGTSGPGVSVRPSTDGTGLTVLNLPIERIGEIAAEHRIVLHELSPQTGSLEEAFIQLTGGSVEYAGHGGTPGGGGPVPGNPGFGAPPSHLPLQQSAPTPPSPTDRPDTEGR